MRHICWNKIRAILRARFEHQIPCLLHWTGKLSDVLRQAKDNRANFLAALRQASSQNCDKTAQLETRRHLQFKCRADDVSDILLRGYSLLRSLPSAARNFLILSFCLRTHSGRVPEHWKDTENQRCESGRVRNAGFCDQIDAAVLHSECRDFIMSIIRITHNIFSCGSRIFFYTSTIRQSHGESRSVSFSPTAFSERSSVPAPAAWRTVCSSPE